MAGKRKGLSKKLRFEIFKRDSFKCQYCGRSAPDVLLQVDHIKPVADGGTDDMINLLTCCSDCNAGKGARALDDNSVLVKQRQQLEEINERREQLKMMMEWHKQLLNLDEEKVDFVAQLFTERTGYHLNDSGRETVRRLVKAHPMDRIISSLNDSANQYLELNPDGKGYTQKSTDKAFDYIERICRMKVLYEAKPYLRELYYIRAILNNRLNYCDARKAIRLLESAHLAGYDIDFLKRIALDTRNWTSWVNDMEDYIAVGGGDQ